MKKLFIFLIFAIPIGVMAVDGHVGNSVTMDLLLDNVNIRVCQWLDVEFLQAGYENLIIITDHTNSGSGVTVTGGLINVDTNATGLYITVDGFYQDQNLSTLWQYNDICTRKWKLTLTDPSNDPYNPDYSTNWLNFGTRHLIIDENGGVSGSDAALTGDNTYLLQLGIIARSKDLPAGKYTLYFKVIFFPWITFP